MTEFPPDVVAAAQAVQRTHGTPASVTLAQWAMALIHGWPGSHFDAAEPETTSSRDVPGTAPVSKPILSDEKAPPSATPPAEPERAGPPTPRPAPSMADRVPWGSPVASLPGAPAAGSLQSPPPKPFTPLPAARDTRWLQQTLNDLGVTRGLMVDGAAGPWTQMALRAFQAARHLPQTGALDPATIRAIEAAVEATSGFQQPAGATADTAGPST